MARKLRIRANEAEATADAATIPDGRVFSAWNNTDLKRTVYYAAPAGTRDPLGVLPRHDAGNAYAHKLRYRCATCGEWQTVHGPGVPDYADCACR